MRYVKITNSNQKLLLSATALLALLVLYNETTERRKWSNGEAIKFFLSFLNQHCKYIDKRTVLKGLHYLLNDHGELYHKCSHNLDNIRTSSHYRKQSKKAKIAPDRYIEGASPDTHNKYVHILIGKIHYNGEDHTWFQVESSPWRSPSSISGQFMHNIGNVYNVVSHGKDYLK